MEQDNITTGQDVRLMLNRLGLNAGALMCVVLVQHTPEPTPFILAPDPMMISAAVILVIGALAAGTVSIIRAINETKQTMKTAAENQNSKLDHIEILVDGRYSTVLDKVAALQEMVAHLTGSPRDRQLAEQARKEADIQQAQVKKADR